jgi:hypothetical protein
MLGRDFFADERDTDYTIPKRASTRMKRYWKDDKVFLNQEQTPACVGHAWGHWLIDPPIQQFMNPHGIYEIAQHFDEWEGTDYNGTSVRAGAKVLKSLGFISEYHWTWDVETMLAVVLDIGPVVVGTHWYDSMWGVDEYGYLKPSGNIVGGHAYIVNGADRRKHCFRIKNSWGRRWGIEGRAYITFQDMARLISENGEVCLAVEQWPHWYS